MMCWLHDGDRSQDQPTAELPAPATKLLHFSRKVQKREKNVISTWGSTVLPPELSPRLPLASVGP